MKTSVKPGIPKNVHKFLVDNGRRGGKATRELVRIGREYASQNGIDIRDEVRKKLELTRRKSA